MSWRYPKSKLRDGDALSIDGLNDGFSPFAEEGQGRLNEQNIDADALETVDSSSGGSGSDFGFTYIPFTYLHPGATGVLYNTHGRFAPGGDEERLAPTQGAMLTPLCTQPTQGYDNSAMLTRNEWSAPTPYPSTANSEGTSPTTAAAEEVEGYWLAWTPQNADLWYVIGEGAPAWFGQEYQFKAPFTVKGNADLDEVLFVSFSLQAMSLSSGGISFGIFINGDLVAESLFGAGDPSNDPTYRSPNAADVNDDPVSMRGIGSHNPGGMARYMGYPVCMDAILPIAAGPFEVEIKLKASSIKGVAIGSRELVVWSMRG